MSYKNMGFSLQQYVDYRIERWYWSNLTKDVFVDLSNLKLTRKNRQNYASGTFILNGDIDNNVEVTNYLKSVDCKKTSRDYKICLRLR